MSTTLPKHDTDSEDDSDYVPSADAGSDSESSSEQERSKDAATDGEPQSEQGEETKKKARDALWSAFQASLESPAPMALETNKTVRIEKRYRFAGEDVVEVVEVAADSPDTKKWPLWRDPNAVKTPSPSKESTTAIVETSTPTPPTAQPVLSTSASSSSAQDEKKPPEPAKRPGPRRPKVSLPSLPSSSAKPKRLSTLDKSAMDWRAHVQSEDSHVKDELEANRRSGGYLEKVEFLKRVDERREEAYEASKGVKRRKL